MKYQLMLSISTLALGVCASSIARASAACGDNLSCNNSGVASMRVSNSTGPGISGTSGSGDPGLVGSGTTGVKGTSQGGGYGVQGVATTTDGIGIYGTNSASGTGNNTAIRGDSTNGDGVIGNANLSTKHGVVGQNLSGGVGVFGVSNTSDGVLGQSTSGPGVVGASTSGIGVQGVTTGASQMGIYGLYFSGSGVGYGVYGQSGSSAGYAGYFNGNLAYTGTLTHVSDARLKKNIRGLEGALDQLLKLRGVTFEWKDPASHAGPGTQWGFIAQEVEQAFPNWVKVDADGFKAIDTTGIDSLLVESMRALKTANDKANVENRALRNDLAKLTERLDALEGKRRPLAAGFGSEGFGYLGIGIAAGAFVLARRKRQSPIEPR